MPASKSLVARLHPSRFPNMSGRMCAIVGYLLGLELTSPLIVGLVRTSDNCILAQQAGDVGFNSFIGHGSDLDSNWEQLLNVAGLSPSQFEEATLLLQERIRAA